MNAKYKLFGSLVVLLVLGLSILSGPVSSNYAINPNLKQSDAKYNMALQSTTFSDNDGDGHNDTVIFTFLINGTASSSVLLVLYASTNMYPGSYNYNKETQVDLNSTGYAIASLLFQANRSARYSIDFELFSLDHSMYYDSRYYDIYLDGYTTPWIPEPSLVSFYNSTYYDNDNDNFTDEVMFFVEINDTSAEKYLTSLSINYTYGWSLGVMSYYSENLHYTTIYNDSNTFSFIFDFVAKRTGDYFFDLTFYDSYGRLVYDMYLYPNHRLDGTQDPYVDFNIWAYLDKYEPVNLTHSYIDGVLVSYGLNYNPNNDLENKNISVTIELWNVGYYDYWYDINGGVHVGKNAYKAASITTDYQVSNQGKSIYDNVTLNVNTANNYILMFKVYCGVYWANISYPILIPVGQYPGKPPIHLEQHSTSLQDTNNDGYMDTFLITGMIYSDLYGNNVWFEVDLYVQTQDSNGTYYVDSQYYNGTSPTAFNFTLSFTADHEDDYFLTVFIFTPWNANYSSAIYNDQVHLYGNNPVSTSTSTSTYVNSTSSSTSSSENSNETTSSTSPSEEEPVQTGETNSSTPQLPLPFQFDTVVFTIASLGLMMIVVRKYKK